MDAERTSDHTTQVIVVGAGPVGLMLAGDLRLGGAEVTVIERLAEPMTESRASTLHARTAELLAQRGLLGRFGPLRSGGAGHFGGIPLDLSRVDSPYAGQWKVAQTDIERELAAWARGLGADIRRRHVLRSVTQFPGRVEVEAEGPAGPVLLKAAYVVGCDGEESTVRELTGVGFPGRDAERELLRADVDGLDIPDRRFERHPAGLAISGRRPDGITRVMVHEFGRRAHRRASSPTFDEVAAAWLRVTGEDISGGTPLWLNAFGDACRQADRYRVGRVLLAGDAAHVQMPVGGQALNLGLQDAVNLGWKLAAQTRGTAPAGLLDTYHDERHAVGARVLANIEAQTTVLLGDMASDALRAVLGELMTLPSVTGHLAGAIGGVPSRHSFGGGGDTAVGMRTPWQPLLVDGGATSVHQLLDGRRGLLVDLRDDLRAHEELRASVEPWADRVRSVLAHFADRAPHNGTGDSHGDGGAAPGGLWLIRPDDCVAWRSDTDRDLFPALHQWFGEPARVPVRWSGPPASR